ncbi:uncharacterized protein [Triticum aestivum]|uniref:uncharacterized protein n=1 Tax=Triticum aestivum TaxID=4565 RepID=UPI001D028EA4|nr:uncharacterized protein LOC123121844 [Triticum aestivum]
MAINRRPKKKRNTRAAHREPLDWLDLPSELLELIAQRSRDPITGLTAFRSVCRTWRAASGQAPRLLLPAPRNRSAPRAGSAHALVFPLPGGWSVVVDARDASCRLSHLTTGATAALPKISAVHDGKTMSDIRARFMAWNLMVPHWCLTQPHSSSSARLMRHSRRPSFTP